MTFFILNVAASEACATSTEYDLEIPAFGVVNELLGNIVILRRIATVVDKLGIVLPVAACGVSVCACWNKFE